MGAMRAQLCRIYCSPLEAIGRQQHVVRWAEQFAYRPHQFFIEPARKGFHIRGLRTMEDLTKLSGSLIYRRNLTQINPAGLALGEENVGYVTRFLRFICLKIKRGKGNNFD